MHVVDEGLCHERIRRRHNPGADRFCLMDHIPLATDQQTPQHMRQQTSGIGNHLRMKRLDNGKIGGFGLHDGLHYRIGDVVRLYLYQHNSPVTYQCQRF